MVVDAMGALEVVATCNGQVGGVRALEMVVVVICSGLEDDMGAPVVVEIHICKLGN